MNSNNKILIFIICFFCNLLVAQKSNPFELTHRLNLPAEAVEGNNVVSTNPFDLVRKTPVLPADSSDNAIVLDTNGTVVPKVLETPEVKSTIKKAKILDDKQVLFILTTGILVFFSIIMTLFRTYLRRIYDAAFSNNLTKSLSEVKAEVFFVALRIWYSFFFISMTLYLYQVSNYFEIIPAGISFWNWLGLLFLVVMGLFFLKSIVLRIIGFVFPIYRAVNQYSFTIVVVSILVGVILLPIDLLLAFGPAEIKLPIIYLSYIIFFIAIGFQMFRGLLIAGSNVVVHKFHFFIYLCTVEIAPILIIVKLFRNYLGA